MRKPFEPDDERAALRTKLIGLGERSVRKSYYPELQSRLAELERFRALLEQSPDGFFLVEEQGGVIRDLNPAGSAHLGLSEPPVGARMLQCLPEEAVKVVAAAMAEADGAGREITLGQGEGCRHLELRVSRAAFDEVEFLVLVTRDVTTSRKAEELLKASLREKEVLLKEIHHRVKNNLQVVSSLLSLQAGTRDGAAARDILMEAQHRIHAMALVHEKLYGSANLADIDLGEYVSTIAAKLFRTYLSCASPIRLETKAEKIMVPIDVAIPLGLIVTELVSNSLKYAFPGGDKGTVRISAARTDTGIELVVQDNGAGLPHDFESRRENSLGLRLVETLVRQVRGIMTMSHFAGMSYDIVIPF